MYVPALHQVDDPATLVAFMRAYNFATVITPTAERTLITHLPTIVDDAGDSLRIRGHLARANPHADSLGESAVTTVVFQGPHAYVSPSLYDAREAVPTWNYIAVHASGSTRVLDADATQAVLEESIATFEPAYRAQWDGLDAAYRDGLSRGVVAFEVDVTLLEGKYKLSQNRSTAEQGRMAAHLARSEDTQVSSVGRAMADLTG
jgi:transcriptional regulator